MFGASRWRLNDKRVTVFPVCLCGTRLLSWNITVRKTVTCLFKPRLFEFGFSVWGLRVSVNTTCSLSATRLLHTHTQRFPLITHRLSKWGSGAPPRSPAAKRGKDKSSLPLAQSSSLILDHLHHWWHHTRSLFMLTSCLLTSATLVVKAPRPLGVCWRDQVDSLFSAGVTHKLAGHERSYYYFFFISGVISADFIFHKRHFLSQHRDATDLTNPGADRCCDGGAFTAPCRVSLLYHASDLILSWYLADRVFIRSLADYGRICYGL